MNTGYRKLNFRTNVRTTRNNTRSTLLRKGSRLYKMWDDMIQRTGNPNNGDYERYGGRGIKVCRQWKLNFLSFGRWALQNGYTAEKTIDRRNNDGHYEPANCRFLTPKEQANNRSTNINIEYKGEVKTLKQWCEHLDLPYATIHRRWSRADEPDPVKVFETPIRRRKK